MKLEYLFEGSDDCPLIRIYGGVPKDYSHLIGIIDDLLNERKKSIYLNDKKTYKPINDMKLEFVLSSTNIGITEVANSDFKCSLTKEGWSKVRQLILPFLNEHRSMHQWLDETSNISLLLTDTGKW